MKAIDKVKFVSGFYFRKITRVKSLQNQVIVQNLNYTIIN